MQRLFKRRKKWRKIEEAQSAYEAAVEASVKDIVYVSDAMYACGADAIILDTVGAAGDADYLAGLKATQISCRTKLYACNL